MITIKVACKTKDSAPLYTLNELQGDLKTIDPDSLQKLKAEIVNTGFAFPVLVWRDVPAKKTYIVGGHQRVRALRELKDKGFTNVAGVNEAVKVPDVPVVHIEAKTLQEAKRRVLQDVAQYGKVTPDGLFEFMKGAKISYDSLEHSFVLPDFDMSGFQSSYFPAQPKTVSFQAKAGSTELDEKDFQKFDHSCPKCNFSFDCDK